jgi:hypothetical protein
MAKADSVYITPPPNTSAIDRPIMFPPRDPTRRRFLAVAAFASVERRSPCRHHTQAQQAGSGVCADRG